MSRPKKYPTPENPPIVAGLHSVHWPLALACGSRATDFCTVNRRICGYCASAISCSALLQPPRLISMFDWPEQTQTSPTKTFFNVIVFFPATTISNGPPAFNGLSVTDHLPPASAVGLTGCFLNVTVTFSPGAAVPQIGTFVSRCKTMFSLMTHGKFPWA